MSSLNRMLLIGRLGKDPECRFAASGSAVATLSIATEESWKDASGDRQKKTEWHRVVAFGKLGEIVGEHTRKGSLVYIEGRLSTRKWVDKQQATRYTTEIIAERCQFLGGAGERAQEPAKAAAAASPGGFDEMEEDIPF